VSLTRTCDLESCGAVITDEEAMLQVTYTDTDEATDDEEGVQVTIDFCDNKCHAKWAMAKWRDER
jgi:uncharacterized protein related to proFAR isomerase